MFLPRLKRSFQTSLALAGNHLQYPQKPTGNRHKLEKGFKETLDDKEIARALEKATYVIENLGSKDTQ
jgi:hypothetical protein